MCFFFESTLSDCNQVGALLDVCAASALAPPFRVAPRAGRTRVDAGGRGKCHGDGLRSRLPRSVVEVPMTSVWIPLMKKDRGLATRPWKWQEQRVVALDWLARGHKAFEARDTKEKT